jgi:GTP 3',8-cyclase
MTHPLPQLQGNGSPRGAASPRLPGLAPAPLQAHRSAQSRRLIDSHGRTIRDLRLSVTDRCNFRCLYCMEPGIRFLPKMQLLRAHELIRLARICAELGIDKIRLTGGEPLVYPELDDVIRGIREATASGPAPPEIALTTNGALLNPARLGALRRAGLSRITISIDSVDPARFASITRSSTPSSMIVQAIEAAIVAGLFPVKVNAVILRGMNEDEIPALAGLARELGIEMRFIEFMPLDSGRTWDRSQLVSADEILQRISDVFPLTAVERTDPSSTAATFRFADGAPGSIGMIAPVTRPFCNQCSRLRITADGKIRPCLFSNQEWDLRPLLRDGATDQDIAAFLIDATWTKQAGHGISSEGFTPPDRHMAAIGG